MKRYTVMLGAATLAFFSYCGKNADTKDSPKGKLTSLNSVDACTLISAADMSTAISQKVSQLGESTYLDNENDFYHYVSLCGFTNDDIMVTIKHAQRKTLMDPKKYRDGSFNVQKKDTEKVKVVESMDINGLPALYYEEYDKDINATISVLILFMDQYETSLIGTTDITKQQMTKACEIIAESLNQLTN